MKRFYFFALCLALSSLSSFAQKADVYVTRDLSPEAIEPLVADYGILASLDPVALDQACFDIVTKIHNDEHNNPQPLLERIESKHGTHIMEWGEKIGLGTRQYNLISID